MTERDTAAVHIENLIRNLTQRARAVQVFSTELRRLCGRATGENLRRKRFVDFNQLGILQSEPAPLFHSGHRIHGAEAHSLRFASGISVLDQTSYRSEPAPTKSFLA